MAFFVLEETLPNKKIVILDDRVPLLANEDVIVEDDDHSHDENTIDSLQSSETAAEPDLPPSLFSLLQEKTVWGINYLISLYI
jgi:hypothetical protein